MSTNENVNENAAENAAENANETENDFDILTLLDEDGQEHLFELVDTVDIEGQEYVALIPYFENPEEMLEDSGELVIMKVSTEEGEDFLDIIEDADEYQKISEIMMDRLTDLFDFEEEEQEQE